MGRIFVVIVMLLTGTTTSQLPEFAQQYRQRLGGAIDALQEVMADFKRDAEAFGMSIDAAIERLKGTPDEFAQRRGTTMEDTRTRLANLEQQQAELQSSGPFARLGVFLTSLDTELARATAEDYEPAVPVTTEGLASAGIGGLIGLVLGRLLLGVGRLGRRKPRPA
ncbi:DUF2937 family protein [Roseibium sediminis]|uniref:DUF2937 family protein n=1 Tax=Roseibium sediminis TaxID=1775174 RepID=UPI00123DE43D|nr:DUF2937 family protein [Roseibium sediminis]